MGLFLNFFDELIDLNKVLEGRGHVVFLKMGEDEVGFEYFLPFVFLIKFGKFKIFPHHFTAFSRFLIL